MNHAIFTMKKNIEFRCVRTRLQHGTSTCVKHMFFRVMIFGHEKTIVRHVLKLFFCLKRPHKTRGEIRTCLVTQLANIGNLFINSIIYHHLGSILFLYLKYPSWSSKYINQHPIVLMKLPNQSVKIMYRSFPCLTNILP